MTTETLNREVFANYASDFTEDRLAPHVPYEVLLDEPLYKGEDIKDFLGFEADIAMEISIGDKVMLVADLQDISTDENGYRDVGVPGVKYDADIMLIDRDSWIGPGKGKGFLGLKEGQQFIFGQDNEAVAKRFNNLSSVAGNHFSLTLGRDSTISIVDNESIPGTLVKCPKPQADASEAEPTGESLVSYARTVGPSEVTRMPDNDGKTLDSGYLENQQAVRGFFVDMLESRELYSGSVSDFSDKLMKAHVIASEGNVYDRAGEGGMKGEHKENIGSFRKWVMYKGGRERLIAGVKAAGIYGDSYANRPTEATGSRYEHRFRLKGIKPEDESYETENSQGACEYYYPRPESMEAYIEQALSVGRKIDEMLGKDISGNPNDARAVVELIAAQYQYLAIARPFVQINNSIFMNLANTQLKLAGLEGISHGCLDLVAQRFSQESFARYFSDVVFGGGSKEVSDDAMPMEDFRKIARVHKVGVAFGLYSG